MEQLRAVFMDVGANLGVLGTFIAVQWGGVMLSTRTRTIIRDDTLRGSLIGGAMDMFKMSIFRLFAQVPQLSG